MATDSVETWHHGLVARWWAEFLHGGDDVRFFQQAIERCGGPALDAGCGTGRLLLPFRRAGLDVDGSDASPDMLNWCRRQAESEGLAVNLYPQAMHALALPRRYRTIVVCGAFGLGGSRADDLEGLRRLHSHLEPGGTLLMDHHLPVDDAPHWRSWVERPELPRPWPARGDRRRAGDGSELELRTRQVEFDPLEQTTCLEMRATHYVGGEEAATETHRIHICLYFKNEVLLMLDAAGFRDVRVTGGLEDRPPRSWGDKRLMFEALA